MTTYQPIKAWQCIGCGSIEAPQTCIGVCEHRKVEFVYAAEHGAVVRELEAARALLRQIAQVTPHGDGWKATYLALQRQARELLGHRPPAPSKTHAVPARPEPHSAEIA